MIFLVTSLVLHNGVISKSTCKNDFGAIPLLQINLDSSTPSSMANHGKPNQAPLKMPFLEAIQLASYLQKMRQLRDN
jgi:hypothetical protein